LQDSVCADENECRPVTDNGEVRPGTNAGEKVRWSHCETLRKTKEKTGQEERDLNIGPATNADKKR